MAKHNIKRLKHSDLIARKDDVFAFGSLTCTVDGVEDPTIQLHKGMALDYMCQVCLDEGCLQIGSKKYWIECTQTKNSKKGHLSRIIINDCDDDITVPLEGGLVIKSGPSKGYQNRRSRTMKVCSKSIDKSTELFIKKIIRENLPRLPLHWY